MKRYEKDKWHSRARRLLRIASMLILIISLAAGSYLWYESFTPTAPVYTYVSVKAGNKSTITYQMEHVSALTVTVSCVTT